MTKTFQNNPQSNLRRRYEHQPIAIDHGQIHCQITPNGRVVISVPTGKVLEGSNEIEVDEVDVPASLIFKLAMFLKGTRKISYVPSTLTDNVDEQG